MEVVISKLVIATVNLVLVEEIVIHAWKTILDTQMRDVKVSRFNSFCKYKISYFFLISIECEVCISPSYICDPDTGRCICPQNSKGPECQDCLINSWGWEYRKGCKTCDCSRQGSIGQSCDILSGKCRCREGFTGQKCNECASGYFGYPNCKPCNCDLKGSLLNDEGNVYCDYKGQCPCKVNILFDK